VLWSACEGEREEDVVEGEEERRDAMSLSVDVRVVVRESVGCMVTVKLLMCCAVTPPPSSPFEVAEITTATEQNRYHPRIQ